MDANVPFSTVYGLKQNFNLINLSNQSLNIIPNNEKTMKIGSDELVVGRNTHDTPDASDVTQTKCDTNNIQRISSTESPTGLRKRNVNWNVPIRLLTKENVGVEYGQSGDLTGRKLDEVREEPPNVDANQIVDRVDEVIGREHAIDDDGFESLNGKSSSGEDNPMTSALLTSDLTGESVKNISQVNDSQQSVDASTGPSEHPVVSSNDFDS